MVHLLENTGEQQLTPPMALMLSVISKIGIISGFIEIMDLGAGLQGGLVETIFTEYGAA